MQLQLLLASATHLAVGFVLRDGGMSSESRQVTAPISLSDALRARQYILLNHHREEAKTLGLLQRSSKKRGFSQRLAAKARALKQKRQFSLFNDTALGETVVTNEVGFEMVAARKSTAAMGSFVHRLLQTKGMRVKDESFMQSVLPYYTGECSNQSYQALLDELAHAQTSKSCHPAWIASIHGSDDADADKDYMRPHTHQDKERAAVVLVRGVLAELGATVISGKRAELWQFAGKFIGKNGTIKQLRQALGNQHAYKTWLTFGTASKKLTFAGTGGAREWTAHIGDIAPLNEEGYEAAVYARDEDEMRNFLQRVALHEGLDINDTDALAGMTPYYSGLCARQSFAALVDELHALQPEKFVTNVEYEITAETMPTVAQLRRSIAAQLGVDMKHVTANIVAGSPAAAAAKSAPAAKAPTNTSGKQELLAKPEAKIAPKAAAPPAQQHPAGPFHRKFHLTISVGSAKKVQHMQTVLGNAPRLLGKGGQAAKIVVEPETEAVGQRKPTQCGGGLVTLA